jgi:hypothetical protein
MAFLCLEDFQLKDFNTSTQCAYASITNNDGDNILQRGDGFGIM